MSTRPAHKSAEQMQRDCDRFNAKHAVGSEIRVWTGPREGYPKRRIISGEATVLGGHTPVVYVTGGGGCIALTHVERQP